MILCSFICNYPLYLMKFVLPLLLLLAACQSAQPVSRQTPGSSAASLIADARTAFSGNRVIEQTVVQDFPWFDRSGIAVNIPLTDVVTFEVTKTATKKYATADIRTAPQISTFIDAMHTWMTAHGFADQPAQAEGQNVGVLSLEYFHPQSGVRCRVEILDPNEGIGDVAPFTYTATLLCADDRQYQKALAEQSPFLRALVSELHPINAYILENTAHTTPCADSSLRVVTLDRVDGTTYGYVKALKKTFMG